MLFMIYTLKCLTDTIFSVTFLNLNVQISPPSENYSARMRRSISIKGK